MTFSFKCFPISHFWVFSIPPVIISRYFAFKHIFIFLLFLFCDFLLFIIFVKAYWLLSLINCVYIPSIDLLQIWLAPINCCFGNIFGMFAELLFWKSPFLNRDWLGGILFVIFATLLNMIWLYISEWALARITLLALIYHLIVSFSIFFVFFVFFVSFDVLLWYLLFNAVVVVCGCLGVCSSLIVWVVTVEGSAGSKGPSWLLKYGCAAWYIIHGRWPISEIATFMTIPSYQTRLPIKFYIFNAILLLMIPIISLFFWI